MRVIDYQVIKDINDLEEQANKAILRKNEQYHARRNYFFYFVLEFKSCKDKLLKLENKIDRRIFCMYYQKMNEIYQKVVKYTILQK